jgi:hypothetical protein
MLDNLERLRNSPQLLQLFSHYATLGEANPEAWRPRLMQMESDGKVDLVKLHGELIAFDFVEQNTGQMPCSYRLTRAGLKAVREIQVTADDAAGTVEVGKQAA